VKQVWLRTLYFADTKSTGGRLTDDDLSSIDLVMLGLKAIEPDLHKQLTGMDTKPVHEFAHRLAVRKHPVWICPR
jgi:pyruvate formate lyase activating enzyme